MKLVNQLINEMDFFYDGVLVKWYDCINIMKENKPHIFL